MITKLKKMMVVGAVAASSLALMGTVAFAQNGNHMSVNINNSGHAQISGTVTAVSGSTISVSSWGGTWAITTNNTTAFSPNNSTLAGIQVGDKVKVQGNISSGMAVTATKVADLSAPAQKKVTGTISNFSATAGTFTLSFGDKSIYVITNSNTTTQVTINGTTSTIESLSNGMSATVSGTFNASANILEAASITVPALIRATDDGNDGKVEKKEFRSWLKAHFNGWFKSFAKR